MQISYNNSSTNFKAIRNTMADKNTEKLLQKLSKKSQISDLVSHSHKQEANPVDVYFRKNFLGLWQGIIYKPGEAKKISMTKWPFVDTFKFTEKVINKAEELKKHIFPAL